jgi:SAM-dependent methyltransferase
MTERFDVQRHVLGPLLTYGLWQWSHHVFRPALVAKSLGLYHPNTLGTPPPPRKLPGGGPELSRRSVEPILLERTPGHYDSVVEFDHCSDDYEQAVKPFSQPVFDELLGQMLPHLVPDARILDPSCGPGIEAMALARLVPEGEVVAADLSRGMVETSWRNARQGGLTNMAFVQADVGDPPGGMAFVADPGPKWFNDMSQPWAKLADPGFVQHRTGADFQVLFRQAGFADVFWIEALPGIGITVAST